ncbi:putative wall-associated receptor kinase-like 16 isoform X2 [Syzygium oleosum]|uniref:putative wall-associated receptor kinase-like 16 isoform X2 n=1 Tax=Syzygium oleosum TaxID=219896 RepID=UPI0024B8B2BD|nr:putative wall-associated receptor kinase-like 16 isoform X2 [Syzygium oleosum]
MKAAVMCFLPMALALATFAEKDNCDRMCGNMSVPFPFGLDESCARNYDFVLICDRTSAPPKLFLFNDTQAFDISVENGTITIGIYISYDCYDKSGHPLDESYPDTSFTMNEDEHYTLSDTRNKLTVFGCDTSALISDTAGTFGSGCSSYCREDIDFTAESACSGLGCCQTSIPKSLRGINISTRSTTDYMSVQNFSSCGSAFVVDQYLFNVSDYKLPVPDDIRAHIDSKVVLDWVVQRDLTCEQAKLNLSTYACGADSFCSYFKNEQGYRCFCEDGYMGNPYGYPSSPGCQAIVAATSCIIVSGLVLFICKRRAKERYFRQNGGEILKHQRVKIFTEAELAKATNNYDAGNKLGEGGFASVYRGRIDGDILVAVKKPRDVPVRKLKDMNKDVSLSTHDEFLHEIGIISQVNHKNLVKLLGICLETKVPLLVYEFIPNGTLYHHIHDKRSTVLRSWKNCLRIASEAASALEYLHSQAEPPVIHSDVKSLNILLDEKYSAKVSDFGASVLISPGKTHIAERIQGTIGYLDPEYLITGELTTKSDVYSFGVVLVELLTGDMPTQRAKSGEKINIIQSFISAVENRTLLHMINFEASNEGELQEIEGVGLLAKRCLNYNGVKRPTMREVAEQLARINKNLWADQQNDEEAQSLLGETRRDSLWTSISEMNKPESTNLLVFDIEAATTSSSV